MGASAPPDESRPYHSGSAARHTLG